MKTKYLLFALSLSFLINACKDRKPEDKITIEKKPESHQVNHLFEDGISTYLLELKPTYTGEDSTDASDSSQYVYTSIIKKSGIDTSLIKSKTEITEKAALSQLQILLNDTSTSRTAYDCYIPRHGIAWYNSNNELEAFLEICFECNGYKTWGSINFNNAKSEAWFGLLEKVLLYKTNL